MGTNYYVAVDTCPTCERGEEVHIARHQIGYGCVGHGAGTWDLITGDFS